MFNYSRFYTLLLAVFIMSTLACGGGGESSATGGSPLLQLLPEDNEVSGWERNGEPRYFSGGNLWEYIHGGADSYLIYGFQTVITADYINGSTGGEAVIDIYEMKDELNTFGIYANERNPEYAFEKIGVEGYAGETSVNFWAGTYYVKITTFEEDEALLRDIRAIANIIALNIGSSATEPAELGYFPVDNIVQYSQKYIPVDVLGQSYLHNGFEVRYRDGAREYKIMLILLEQQGEAEIALNQYREFINTSGEVLKSVQSPGDGGFVGEDGYYGSMMAVRSGRALAVILAMPSETGGRASLETLLSRLN